MKFFDILFEIEYIKKLMNNYDKCQINYIIKSCIKNKPIELLNQIINELNNNNNSLRMSIFGYY